MASYLKRQKFTQDGKNWLKKRWTQHSLPLSLSLKSFLVLSLSLWQVPRREGKLFSLFVSISSLSLEMIISYTKLLHRSKVLTRQTGSREVYREFERALNCFRCHIWPKLVALSPKTFLFSHTRRNRQEKTLLYLDTNKNGEKVTSIYLSISHPSWKLWITLIYAHDLLVT